MSEPVAVVMARADGTFTVTWGERWSHLDRLPGTWPDLRDAMRAVERVAGHAVIWRQNEPHLWEGRPLNAHTT